MRVTKVFGVLLLLVGLFSSCEAQFEGDLIDVLLGQDRNAPKLLEVKVIDSHRISCTFDERVFCKEADFFCSEHNSIASATVYENRLTLTFASPLRAGEVVEVGGRISDQSGNTLSFTTPLWGYNGEIPPLLINEFVTKGSGNNPDRVELLALERGNLAGVTLYDGVKESYDSKVILPNCVVEKNSYIVIEYGETLRGVHEIEFWGGATGLGANNGVITLYDSPSGNLIDGVLYSNRSSSSDTQYSGFGTKKVEERAFYLSSAHGWDSYPITPESGVDSTFSTATRSMCRTESEADTDTKEDWHIVPTSKATFGFANVSDHFIP